MSKFNEEQDKMYAWLWMVQASLIILHAGGEILPERIRNMTMSEFAMICGRNGITLSVGGFLEAQKNRETVYELMMFGLEGGPGNKED